MKEPCWTAKPLRHVTKVPLCCQTIAEPQQKPVVRCSCAAFVRLLMFGPSIAAGQRDRCQSCYMAHPCLTAELRWNRTAAVRAWTGA